MQDDPQTKDLRRWIVTHTDVYLGTITIDSTIVIGLIDRIKNLEELRELDRKKINELCDVRART